MMLILAALVALASVASDPAAGVIVGVSGHVVVQGASSSSQPATLGMRLAPTDVVVVDRGATASVYLKGGGVVRLTDATRFAIPKSVEPHEGAAKLKSGTIAQLESGLWVLNDPSGSLLVSPMRGDAGWEAGDAPLPLTPRYEALTETKATFAWTGGPPKARVVVAKKRDVVWRSEPAAPGKPLAAGSALALAPGEVYTWWLEPEAGGAPLSAGVPFRVAAADVLDRTRALEGEVGPLPAETANYLELAHYVGASSWTHVMALASVMPEGEARKRALAAAAEGLRLDERGAKALAAQLVATKP
ncbi:MAG TPA: hypothetical protein VFV19_10785 [Candidatus Polarisedimenticolaceae bacterium]|nr:hypothetical protein [Candidatus Polarisedimenticolaceae bacterium]